MNKFEVLDNLVKEGNGYLCTSDVLKAGISKTLLSSYVKEKKMERVEHGVYLSNDAWQDNLYELSLVNNRIVFSHETALMLHGLMEREPNAITVTVPQGYNATHLRKKGINVHQVKPEMAELGVVEIDTFFGNKVPVYNKERTICDILKSKDSMDVQIFQYALKEYMSENKKNFMRLMIYAEKLRIVDKVRVYTEMIL